MVDVTVMVRGARLAPVFTLLPVALRVGSFGFPAGFAVPRARVLRMESPCRREEFGRYGYISYFMDSWQVGWPGVAWGGLGLTYLIRTLSFIMTCSKKHIKRIP